MTELPATTDLEAMIAHEPATHKTELRLWLRLLSCTNLLSAEIRKNLRTEFDVTLPRFDLMAQLYREPDGLRLSELSKRMMVTNGNLTGLVDRLASEGLVLRDTDASDRRAAIVTLSAEGKALFKRMAAAHDQWIAQLFQGLDAPTLGRLIEDLQSLKTSLHRFAG